MKILISFFIFFLASTVSVQAADLKQLAEQLVNLTVKPIKEDVKPSQPETSQPQEEKMMVDVDNKNLKLNCTDDDCDASTDEPAIRDAGRTVSAGQVQIADMELDNKNNNSQGDDSAGQGEEQRTGRNPQTGKEIKVPAKNKEMLNQNNYEEGDKDVESVRRGLEETDTREYISDKKENQDKDFDKNKDNIKSGVITKLKQIKNLPPSDKNREVEGVKQSIIDSLSKYNLKDVQVEIKNQGEQVQAVIRQTVEKKLFWFIPIKAKVEVIVNSNGEVEVKKPWYSFLLGKFEIESIW